MTPEQLSLLAQKYLSGQATEEEKKLLSNWYNNFDDDMELGLTGDPKEEKDLEQRMKLRLEQIILTKQQTQMTSKFRRSALARWAAVVAFILVIVSLLVLKPFNRSGNKPGASTELIVQNVGDEKEGEEEDEEKEDGIRLAQEYEFEVTKDVSLGYIPKYKLIRADEELKNARLSGAYSNRVEALSWTERGPNSDGLGASNGNTRGSQPATDAVTSGRMRAIWVDLTSSTTVWAGGVDGGLWKSTNITSAAAGVWSPVNDFLGNLAIASICQDPSNTNTMYFGTGEKTFNADAVQGGGVWKSTDHGVTWNLMTNTTSFINVSRVLCDAAGNIYVSTIGPNGIQRSTDGGANWTNITPTGLVSYVTEMRIASTGRLHIVCGYNNTGVSGYRFTDIPATVAAGTWTSPTTTFPTAFNSELAVGGTGATLYALPSNASDFTPTIYKSIDGGDNWNPTATSPPGTGTEPTINAGQGWYDLAIGVDPTDDNNVIAGGLNFYRTTNGGGTWTQITRWVGTTINYVHADHHTVVWSSGGVSGQVLVGSDGGIFYSNNNGTSFVDRNDGLRIKQFYACAIHPSSTNYFLAGAQDNGVHQLNTAGIGSSVEVIGGDGAFVHIDQDEPQFQWGAYVFSQYRRSVNSGANWSQINYSSSIGQFINITDYDDIGNKMYTSAAANQYVRWDDAQTGATFTPVTVAAFNGNTARAITVSPYTANRVFFGTAGGRIVRVDNANTAAATGTYISSGSGMTASVVSSVAVGTSDNNLMATFSNYGAIHIWVTTNGGTNWTNISGTGLTAIPDIPVRWAMFYPEDNTKAIVATEMGIYETSLINGASTVWTQNSSFPVVRTNMLQYRKSDGLVVAATHGRGLWSAPIPFTNPYVRFAFNYNIKTEGTTASGSVCRNYTDYVVNMTIDQAPVGAANVTLNLAGGGTATQGVDFDFTTNGNFAAPSNTLTFPNGSTTPQPVTIRIYNDVEVESSESFTLNYSIGGGTNALAAPSSSSYTFTIDDNDVAPVTPFNGNFTVGANNVVGGIIAQTPFRSNQQKFRIQSLFTAGELQAAGITTAANLTAMTLRISTKNSTQPYNGFTISLGNTTAGNLSTGFIAPLFTQVFNGNYSSVVGDNTFTFTTPFAWDGTSNVVVQWCFDNAPAAAEALADATEGTIAPLGTGVRASTYSNSAVGAGCSLAAAFISDARVTATFAASAGTPIETVLNSNRTEYLASNGTFYFYNGSNIINSLTAVTANLGCVTSNIFEAGNTWQPFLGGFRSQKVFEITPTTNPGAGYTVGIYLTAAELSTYSGTPGTLRMAKTTAATMAAANAGNTVKANSTSFTAFGTGYLFTASFTGFSKFFLVDVGVTLPVTLLSFDGHLDKKIIQLDWSTSQELNSKHFEIEKSTDGTNFRYIGKVQAAGSSISQRDYNFIDRQVSENNYYRLRMVDIDDRFAYSKTILIRNPDAVQQLWVVNNPFSSYIDIRLAKMPKQPIKLELVNIAGARVYYKEFGTADQARLDLSGIQLSKATYILRATIDGKQYTSKVMRE